MSIATKGKGKSGGARVITYLVNADKVIYLLSIYDKSVKDSLSDEELPSLLEDINDL
jgi:hypothetical protein